MRVTTISCTGKRTTAITLEAGEGEDLADFETMLGSHKWIRQNEYEELESAPAHIDPPILFDKDIDPIWHGKPATIRQLREAEKKDINVYTHRSFYVQHIAGYDGDRFRKAQKLVLCGFSVLRSKRGINGKCWEIWYLPGAWAAEGELRNKSEDKILDWLIHEIRLGTIDLSGQSLGLAF